MKDNGVMTNEDYPYMAMDQSCAHDSSKVYGHVKEYDSTPKKNVEAMKERIMRQPVAVALNADAPGFRFYKSGVLKSCCDPANEQCDEDSLTINHAVTVVGYNEKSTKTKKCNVNDWWINCEEEGEGEADADGDSNYWKVMNSYGADWGDNGFMKVAIDGPTDHGVCRMHYWGAWWADWDFPEDQN